MNEKILIMDDEEDVLTLLSAALEGDGYEVATVTDGHEGMDKFQSTNPDLVIADVKMPVKNGLEVLKEIKESGRDVDVIILSGHSDETTAIDCLRNGAYDYLVKPLEDIDVLLAAVERCLQKRMLEVKNKQLIKQLEEMASKDSLTGLYNYRHLATCLGEEVVRSKRYGHSFCCLMLDIDHFKALNDIFGHLFGDYVVRKLGEIIGRSLRSADHIFRYGGGQFLIIMPETPQEEAISACNRLMKAIRSHTFECNGHRAKITVSIGGAVYPEESRDEMELIKHAGQSLYHAKETQRDRVIFSLGSPWADFGIRIEEQKKMKQRECRRRS